MSAPAVLRSLWAFNSLTTSQQEIAAHEVDSKKQAQMDDMELANGSKTAKAYKQSPLAKLQLMQ